MITIPKKIFLIWIGNKPSYIDNVVSAYRLANPDFNVQFKHISSLVTTNDIEFNICLNIFLDAINNTKKNTNNIVYLKLYWWYVHQLSLMKNIIKYNQNIIYNKYNIINRLYAHITDGYRFYLLYKYGGIYVDCDTFPVKPFDDILLQHQEFRAEHDIYFLGSIKNNYLLFIRPNEINNINEKTTIFQTKIGNKYTYDDAKQFFNGKLLYKKLNLGEKYYIHHFCNRSWVLNYD